MRDVETDFQIRTAKARKAGRQSRAAPKFVTQVVRAANGSVRRVGPSRGSISGSFGRGQTAALRMQKLSTSRRVIVKSRIVRHIGSNASGAGLSTHIKYLERDGIGQHDKDPSFFDADCNEIGGDGFTERCKDDRHHFRFLVSPEDATKLYDMRETTRDFISQVERDLGTKLDWQAVDHWNTDNPHVHILVRGVDDSGKDLVISRDYISYGMRKRAEQLVTLELGQRTEQEIQKDLSNQVEAERWTKLDYNLHKRAERGIVDLTNASVTDDRDYHQALIGRAQNLEKMGLAEGEGPARWSLRPDAEKILRDLGMRGDIIKTMHRAMRKGGREPNVSEFSIGQPDPENPIVGKLVERGLHDEQKGDGFAIVDGVDGRTHYLRFGNIDLTSDANTGSIVETRSWTDKKGRQGFALAVRSDFDLAAQVKAEGATWIDRQLITGVQHKIGGGFGREVKDAMEQRADHLEKQGLLKRQSGRMVFARRMLARLRKFELEKAAEQIANQTGIQHRPSATGEYLSGKYSRRLDLASGRYAVIESVNERERSFELAPWKPSLEKQLGKHVQGLVMLPGRVDWQLGRQKTLER